MVDTEQNLPEESSHDYIRQSFELKNLKLYKEAIEMLYKALSCDDIKDGAVEVISQIGDLYSILKNYERAIEQYEKALELNKTHAHSLFGLCEIYFIQKKFDLALNLVRELCKNSPEVENYIRYFKILYELKKFEEISDLYKIIDDEAHENPEILYIMSLCDAHNKKHLLEKIIQNEPNNAEAKSAMFDLAVINFKERDYERAKELFEQITQKESNSKAFYYLGLMESLKGNFSNAVTNFLKAVKKEQGNSAYHFELAKAYAELGWLKEAEICVRKSIELGADDHLVTDERFYFLATINHQNKNYENALLNLEYVSPGSHLCADALILKNVIRLEQGDLIFAKKELETECAEQAQNPVRLSALGRIYKEMRDTKKAIEIYEQALELFPDSVEFTGELTDLLIDAKDYERAHGLALNLKNTHPRALCAYNSLARIYYRQKEYDKALEELENLIALDINSAESHYFMGLILNDAERPLEAVKKLKTAISIEPNRSKYYFQLARAFDLAGRAADAFLYAKEACLMTPQEPAYAKLAYELATKNKLEADAKFYAAQVRVLEKRA